ncbi:hypothetical protein [Roseateles amylovorans]|uniref:Uncharacterized protein n=1 Tax=Roseateles amylovorans TaxID=2978473 RepID=A0ABY6B540_9BURK|nr:hypothetical protein [Roseateles amylovorans]UXH80488.1 hypothetical protein N4261_11710 [Roseateles amylovorans]
MSRPHLLRPTLLPKLPLALLLACALIGPAVIPPEAFATSIAIAPRGKPGPTAKKAAEAASAAADAQEASTLDSEAAAGLSDEAFRADAEATVLRKVGALAKRDGLRLMLYVQQGRPVMLDSLRPDPGDSATPYIDFRLDGMTKDSEFFIVRATLGFGSEVLWISRADGQRYEMHGNVHPSPDGRHLVVTHASPGVEFNGVVIWAREAGRLVERYRFQLSPEQRAVSFRFMRWRDANTIELEQFAEVDPDVCATGTLDSLAVLARKSDRWILRSASTPRCSR